MRDLFQAGAVVEAQGVEPVLLLLSEGKRESAVGEADCGVVIGERLDAGGEPESSGAMDDLRVLVSIDGAGDEEIASGVDILQQRLPRFFAERLRRRQDGELRRA